jgi:hypothetical protein
MGITGIVGAFAGLLAASAAAWVLADVLRNSRVRKAPAVEGNRGSDVRALLALHDGRPYLPSDISLTCDYVDRRADCADFSMQTLLRILIGYREKLAPADAGRIEATLLGFKYWMDEPGDDGMCTWSENHQILFATAEYLAGGLLPDRTFTNAGMTGAAHRAKARARILDWLALRWDYGFSEWYSNVYYVEDAAALSNLIDFAGDEEVAAKARIVMDLLLYDIASQSHAGFLVSSSGRLYEGNKKRGREASTNGIVQHAFGLPVDKGAGRGLDAHFLLMRGYQVPPVLRAIASDPEPREIRASSGLDVRELAAEGLRGPGTRQIMAQWGMEAFTNPPVICNTLRIVDRHHMLSNSFLHDLKAVRIGLLWRTGLLAPVSAVLRPQQDGVAIQRADTYTYRTPAWSMYTAQAHHPGECADQQHVHGVTLDGGTCVFTTHPAARTGRARNEDQTPSYWVGCGRLPSAAQEGNVTLVIYKLPRRAGLLENPILPFTHAWFPKAELDEAVVEGNHAFGRKGRGFIGMTAAGPLRWADAECSDLVQDGRLTWWILEAGDADEGFDAFARRIRGNRAELRGSALLYQSTGHRYELDFRGNFHVDGQLRSFRYPRFDCAYVHAERKPRLITISHDGDSLTLDFEAGTRTIAGSSEHTEEGR